MLCPLVALLPVAAAANTYSAADEVDVACRVDTLTDGRAFETSNPVHSYRSGNPHDHTFFKHTSHYNTSLCLASRNV